MGAVTNFLRDVLNAPWRAPSNTRKNRLARKAMHEVTIYLGDDNMIYVQHLCLDGKGQAEVAIRMCWEAMQHLAHAAGVGINLPTEAAIPAQIVPLPKAPEPVPAGAENGSH